MEERDLTVKITGGTISQAPYTIKVPSNVDDPSLHIRPDGHDAWICDSGIRLNAVESASASVAVGAMTLTVL